MRVIYQILSNIVLYALRLTQHLPVNLITGTGRIIGYYSSYFSPKELDIAIKQIKFALELDDKQAQSLARRSFAHLGQSVAETLVLPKLLSLRTDRLKLNSQEPSNTPELIADFAHIEAAEPEPNELLNLIHQKKGAVVISGHLGSFELLAAAYIKLGANGAAFARSPNYALLESFVKDLRQRYGLVTLWRGAPGTRSKLLSTIKNNGKIIALIDQDTKLQSEFAPFFGLPAASPVAPLKIALKYQLPIFSCFIVRNSNHNHISKHIIFTEKICYDKSDSNVLANILTIYNQRLESLIRQYPEQWLWWHRRWRREPGTDYNKLPDKLSSTSVYLDRLSRLTSESDRKDKSRATISGA